VGSKEKVKKKENGKGFYPKNRQIALRLLQSKGKLIEVREGNTMKGGKKVTRVSSRERDHAVKQEREVKARQGKGFVSSAKTRIGWGKVHMKMSHTPKRAGEW